MTAPNLLESSEQEELYLRGLDTLLASWEAYARGAYGAAVHRLPDVATAVYAAVGFRDLGRILEYVPVEGER